MRRARFNRSTPTRQALDRRRVGRDTRYLRLVRRLPCVVVGIATMAGMPCTGPTHAHHAGRRPGVALKAPDDTAIPLCHHHHAEWHDLRGYFLGWTKTQRRQWSDEQIAATRAELSVDANGNPEDVL